MKRSIAVLTAIEIMLMGALSVAPQAHAQVDARHSHDPALTVTLHFPPYQHERRRPMTSALSVASLTRVAGSNSRIVYIRSDSQGNNLAYTTNPDGSDERLLFPGRADFARWSPDGSQVDVRHSDSVAATIVDAETGTTRDLQIPDPAFTCTPATTQEECENTDFSYRLVARRHAARVCRVQAAPIQAATASTRSADPTEAA